MKKWNNPELDTTTYATSDAGTKIENQLNSPQLNSLIKILKPIGFTVKIVPIEKDF